MRIRLIFAWFDFWIGMFYDKKKKWLYVLPIPMFGVVVELMPTGYRIEKRKTHLIGEGVVTMYTAWHDYPDGDNFQIGTYHLFIQAYNAVLKNNRLKS